MKRSEIEIMAPVGSYESLMAAIHAGADSVYFGVGKLNMRSASAANFTLDDLGRIVKTAHEHGVKTYLTVNTVVYEDEMADVHAVIDRARAEGVDAIIATDFAAILYARRVGVEVHISTQSNISNSEAVRFFAQWADTVVLARELSLEQVAAIHRQIVENDIRGPKGELVEIEMFAHGALCMAISGKCYLSLHETSCSANRGACRQICRRKYTITDRETGQALDIDGRYILSPKDLCTIDFLDRMVGAGVRVLKIEGRARGAEYVKRVVECYDRALRAMEAGEYTPELAASLKERLATVFNRGFWEGYYAGRPRGARSTWARWSTSTRRFRWPRCWSRRLRWPAARRFSSWGPPRGWPSSGSTSCTTATASPPSRSDRANSAPSRPGSSSTAATSSTSSSPRSSPPRRQTKRPGGGRGGKRAAEDAPTGKELAPGKHSKPPPSRETAGSGTGSGIDTRSQHPEADVPLRRRSHTPRQENPTNNPHNRT